MMLVLKYIASLVAAAHGLRMDAMDVEVVGLNDVESKYDDESKHHDDKNVIESEQIKRFEQDIYPFGLDCLMQKSPLPDGILPHELFDTKINLYLVLYIPSTISDYKN